MRCKFFILKGFSPEESAFSSGGEISKMGSWRGATDPYKSSSAVLNEIDVSGCFAINFSKSGRYFLDH